MQYTVLCVGKIKERFYSEAIGEYVKRLSRYANIHIVEVPDEKTPERASAAEEQGRKKREGERLLSKIKETMYVIALDLRGREYDSVAFARHVNDCMVGGKSHIAFLIGGSLGLADDVLARADEMLCFSKFTFPHQLMRVILLEQLYRANRILKNEPYHK